MNVLLSLVLAAGVTVRLPEAVEVRGTELTLGDVAQVAGSDPDAVAAVRALSLGYTPAPGFLRVLERERIASRIAQVLPGLEVVLAGDTRCRVMPLTERVPGEEIAEAARAELARMFASKDAELVLREPVASVEVPAGRIPHGLAGRADARIPESGFASVPVQILVDGEPYRTVWTSWRIDVWETVPVLRDGVRAGEYITPPMLERRRIKVNGGGQLPLGPGMVAGSIASRDLAPASVVTTRDVHRPALVEAGDAIFLQVRKGPIRARVAAVALESGAAGDRIRVLLRDAEEERSAVVVSRDLVDIDLAQQEAARR